MSAQPPTEPPTGLPGLPPAVLGFRSRGEEWEPWVDALPELRRYLLEEWELELDGVAMYGYCALVHPVRTAAGERAVLKLSGPTWDGEQEHLALRLWSGRGAVRLLRADPHRWALLLETADAGHDLNTLPDLEACAAVARLYGDLHVVAPPQLRLLSDQARRWSAELRALPAAAPLPRRYVEQAAELAGGLAAEPACDGQLVHTDLHYDNVLASLRDDTSDDNSGEWLAIDPKPLSGDPHFEVAPLLWNRWDELVATGDVRAAIRARFHTVVDTAGLDEARARDWVAVRELVNAMWALTAGDVVADGDGFISQCVTITKAVLD